MHKGQRKKLDLSSVNVGFTDHVRSLVRSIWMSRNGERIALSNLSREWWKRLGPLDHVEWCEVVLEELKMNKHYGLHRRSQTNS